MRDTVIATYRPAPSWGWAWLLALTVLVVLPMVPVYGSGPFEGEDLIALWVSAAVVVPIGLFFLVVLASLPMMRYDLTVDALVISCGPMLRYRVGYDEIVSVARTDLRATLWSSMRMPGIALWGVLYAGTGTVHMCATRMAKGVLLIRTARRLYGITPADEDAFVAGLKPLLAAHGVPDAFGRPFAPEEGTAHDPR